MQFLRKKTSRRQFLKLGAAAASGVVCAPILRALDASSAQSAPPSPLSLFDYSQVQLLEGPFRQQFDHNHQLFLNLNEDALLKPFRQRAGMKAPGPKMGGWYDNANDFDSYKNFHGFIPGHSFGQYLSSLARAYAITNSTATQEKVHRLVQAYAETLDPAGSFYVDYRLPAYTFDKICCGLIDAHQFAADPDALKVLARSTDSALWHLPEKALSREEMTARPHKERAYTWDESYTLPENFFLAYQRSGTERYRDLAIRFLYKDYFDPLAEGQNVLSGKHAYSHVNTLSSAMQAYLVLNDEKYLRAAVNGFRMVQEQSYATGGWGPDESFFTPGKGRLAKSLTSTHSSFETPCGAYGHFKITRYLLRVTRDSRYGDSMEQVLYNTIAGAKPILADGTSFYYSDYNNQGTKVYYKDKWPCCSGTFPQLTADYGISSYYLGNDGIYVNLFIPSRVTWLQHKTQCTLELKTDYPRTNTVQIDLTLSRSEKFSLYLRIPEWIGPKTILSINGRKCENEIVPGKFLALQRHWKNGDRVEFEIDMPLRLQAVDSENPDFVALLRGPLALFAVGSLPDQVTRQQLLAATAASQSSDDWIVKGEAGNITLRPFTAIGDESYRLYLDVGT